MAARVRIVIPTLRSGPLLSACLASLARQTFRDFEVVVVLNGLGPEPLQTPPLTGLRWVRAPVNWGFGRAINEGAAGADAEFIVALNDDTVADSAWLEEMVAALERRPEAGMAAPVIVRSFDQRIDSAGMALARDGSSKQRGAGQDPERFAHDEPVLFASGCAAIYRRHALDQVGGFDPEFFLYCEDTDLGLRLQRAGWSCWLAARARIEHHYSATGGAASPRKVYFAERNRLAVAVKNLPWEWCAGALPWSMVRYFWHGVYLFQRRGYPGQPGSAPIPAARLLRAVAQAHADFLTWLPRLLAARKRIAAHSAWSSSEWRALLRQHQITLREVARA